jgi:hypothetical protein
MVYFWLDMSNIQPPLMRAVWADLERDVKEFAEAKWQYEQARYQLAVARERFAATKRVANGVMTFHDWDLWQERHPEVKYTGMAIGEAIESMLHDKAFKEAIAFAKGERDKFIPGVRRDDLIIDLERGGFEFKTITPLREIHAALIHLKHVKEGGHGYEHVDAGAALSWAEERFANATNE